MDVLAQHVIIFIGPCLHLRHAPWPGPSKHVHQQVRGVDEARTDQQAEVRGAAATWQCNGLLDLPTWLLYFWSAFCPCFNKIWEYWTVASTSSSSFPVTSNPMSQKVMSPGCCYFFDKIILTCTLCTSICRLAMFNAWWTSTSSRANGTRPILSLRKRTCRSMDGDPGVAALIYSMP